MALIIFDIDGTLFQSQLVTIPALQQTFEAFGLEPPTDQDIIATFGVPVEKYEAWLAQHAPGREEALVEAANKRELELIGETGELYPGAIGAMEALQAAGHVLAACSNGSVAYVDEVIRAHGLRPLFQEVRCIGQGYAGKKAMVADLMEGIAARPVAVVGDRHGDVEGAHANGAVAIGAAYGFGDDGELAEADAQIQALAELPGAVSTALGP